MTDLILLRNILVWSQFFSIVYYQTGKKCARVLYNDCSVYSSVYSKNSFSFVHKINTFYIRCICYDAWESAMEVPMKEWEYVRLCAFVCHETEIDVARGCTQMRTSIFSLLSLPQCISPFFFLYLFVFPFFYFIDWYHPVWSGDYIANMAKATVETHRRV